MFSCFGKFFLEQRKKVWQHVNYECVLILMTALELSSWPHGLHDVNRAADEMTRANEDPLLAGFRLVSRGNATTITHTRQTRKTPDNWLKYAAELRHSSPCTAPPAPHESRRVAVRKAGTQMRRGIPLFAQISPYSIVCNPSNQDIIRCSTFGLSTHSWCFSYRIKCNIKIFRVS